jgi:hypothetical protein
MTATTNAGKITFSGLGHQFNRPSRNLSACISSLNEAYAVITEMGNEHLKELINAAIEEASSEAVAADDLYNSKV